MGGGRVHRKQVVDDDTTQRRLLNLRLRSFKLRVVPGLAMADTGATMRSDRAYAPAVGSDLIRLEVQRQTNRQFASEIARAYLDMDQRRSARLAA